MDSSQAFGSTTPFAEPLWYSRTDNPNYTESHRRLRQAVRQYVDTEIVPFVSEWEEKGAVPPNVRGEEHRLLSREYCSLSQKLRPTSLTG